MIIKFFRKNKIKNRNIFVEPDEIFLDSKNLENFDKQQFEGRIEKSISKNTIYSIGFVFLTFIFIFTFRLFYLQINKGEAYFKRSENNKLGEEIIFADRGIIYDRNKIELVWNKKEELIKNENGEYEYENDLYLKRAYLSPGFAHLIGYVNSPIKDKSGKYWQEDFIGKEGLEKQYDYKLKGKNGSKIVEKDAKGKIHSFNIVNPPKRGEDLITSIDSKIQQELFNLIKSTSTDYNFSGGAGVIMDIDTGEIITSVSYPEYDSEVLSKGEDKEKINSYINDKRKVFLNKTTSGLYTPGSIVKPFFAYGALNEKIINPEKKIYSSGSISIPNPYDKSKPTIFKDWKAHGWTNMKEAIAVSSDVYFYSISGGFEEQRGLGISNLEKYARFFKIGESTEVDLQNEKSGVIPNPEWKKKHFKGEIWRVGDTYNTSIGQYGFLVTPLEMARSVAILGNGGYVLNPHFLLNDKEKEEKKYGLDLNQEYLKVIQEGMRGTILYGTATSLNVPYVQIAGKTGTAQVGISKSKVNSWVIGFFPYEKPKYSFAIMMEAGPSSGTISASYVMRQLLDYMSINTPEYFKLE